MADAVSSMTLTQRLAKIRKVVDVVAKEMAGYGYKYSDINEILAKVKGGMEKYRVSLVPEIIHGTTSAQLQTTTSKKFDKAGNEREVITNEMLVSAEMHFRWVNDDNSDDCLVVPWYLIGSQSDPSQAFGSALTYTTRYFLLSFFQIAQDNDVDTYRSTQKEAFDAEEIEALANVIKTIDSEIRAFIADHEDAKESIKKLCAKYAKDGNYKSIKEVALANKLLGDFREKFVNADNK